MDGTGADPGTAAQMAWTSVVGPPINVVPVSMAERAELPEVIGTFLPCTVTAVGQDNKHESVTERRWRTVQVQKPEARCLDWHVEELDITSEKRRVGASEGEDPSGFQVSSGGHVPEARHPEGHLGCVELPVVGKGLPERDRVRGCNRGECKAENSRYGTIEKSRCQIINSNCWTVTKLTRKRKNRNIRNVWLGIVNPPMLTTSDAIWPATSPEP